MAPGAHRRATWEPWQRAALRRALAPLLLLVAGLAVVVAGGPTAQIVGWGIVGVAATVAISLVFLEVGYSEDRERAREQARRDRPRGGSGPYL